MAESLSLKGISYSYKTMSGHLARLQDEFIYGGHLTALGAPMMVLSVSILFNLPASLPLLFIAYVETLIVYSFDYYGTLEKDAATNRDRALNISRKARLYPYLIAFYAAALLVSLALFASAGLVLLTLVLAACGILYSTVFKNVTRIIPGFKNVFTSAIWAAGCTFGLPLQYSRPVDAALCLVFLFMLARGLSNNIFFDLKDIESDAGEGLKTLPVLLGERHTVILLCAINLAAVPILIAGVQLQLLPAYALSMIALVLSTFAYLGPIAAQKAKNMGYTYYLLADVEVLSWPLVLIIGRAVFTFF